MAGGASEALSVFTAASHHSHYHLSSTSCQHYGELYNYFIIYYNVIIIEIKCTINVMRLSHPETIPPLRRGKIVFHKTGPWCQKCWGPLVYSQRREIGNQTESEKIAIFICYLHEWYFQLTGHFGEAALEFHLKPF